MTTIGNFLWFFMGGFAGALLWGFAALVFCWTPYAMSFLQMSKLYLAPFGKDIVSLDDIAKAKRFAKGLGDGETVEDTPEQAWSTMLARHFNMPTKEIEPWVKRLGMLFNILWIPFGLALACFALFVALIQACTIIGLPFVPVCLRIARLSIWPIGMRVVDRRYGEMIRDALCQQKLRA